MHGCSLFNDMAYIKIRDATIFSPLSLIILSFLLSNVDVEF
jgi:hypothetical protein